MGGGGGRRCFCDCGLCDIGEFIQKIYSKKAAQVTGCLMETWHNIVLNVLESRRITCWMWASQCQSHARLTSENKVLVSIRKTKQVIMYYSGEIVQLNGVMNKWWKNSLMRNFLGIFASRYRRETWRNHVILFENRNQFLKRKKKRRKLGRKKKKSWGLVLFKI